ncbi:amyloid A4 extracellular domain protein [Trichinella spiralis]|uniref:amyloid A4 extracellular domain protein n=1 Tax=Trichinella spiralis TaxID=6334 RepID=UPI0001EFBCD7|nr:amyloid A4 extracellular domain protein [Trichinella spiralis]
MTYLTRFQAVSGGYAGSAASNHKTKANAFVPQVVFRCGFRNRYMTEDGSWASDPDSRASCLTGKLDILKYCRKVYWNLTVTNIVESSHFVEVDNWCKDDGYPCKWSFWVKPYRCMVGEFESDALLVPKNCHFEHVDDENICKDFDYWNQTAIKNCKRRNSYSVLSFAMLEPCGLDMFSGVEFVCCPNRDDINADVVNVGRLSIRMQSSRDRDNELYGPAIPNDSEEYPPAVTTTTTTTTRTHSTVPPPALLTTASPKTAADDDEDEDDDEEDYEEDDDDDDDDDAENEAADADNEKSAYLRVADPEIEHEAYKNALEHLTKVHHKKVSKVMKEWSELENRYQEMKRRDPKHAESFKNEMNMRFQKTVAALEEENADERHQIEDIHQQRVMANLNEKKRLALKEFHQLYDVAGPPPAHAILRTLKAYVRAEEKDRVHLLNHYRHMLRSKPQESIFFKSDVLNKLVDIDRRINATISLLKFHPEIDKKVRTAIEDFFHTYRRENTPDIAETFPDGYLTSAQYHQLLNIKLTVDQIITLAPSVKVQRKEITENTIDPVQRQEQTISSLPLRNIHVVEEDISLLNKKQDIVHDFVFQEKSIGKSASKYIDHSFIFFSIAGVSLIAAVVCGIFFMRHRANHAGQGFIEVSACTPEERHVANMQISGYENPAYKYFEENL